ncbi:hypothetical protein J6590_035761 [Homalodisca vitripennis]|nr:hypothetical protein J6590_035761 [Homalodisca vitripennis]
MTEENVDIETTLDICPTTFTDLASLSVHLAAVKFRTDVQQCCGRTTSRAMSEVWFSERVAIASVG